MAEQQRYPHLFIGEAYRSESGYTLQRTGRDEQEKMARDRPVHAALIKRNLAAAWGKAAGSRTAVGTTILHGVYLEFEIDRNSELPISTLDARSQGVELRNIRSVKDGEVVRQLATVFVPADTRAFRSVD